MKDAQLLAELAINMGIIKRNQMFRDIFKNNSQKVSFFDCINANEFLEIKQ